MLVNIWNIVHGPIFGQCEPLVVAGRGGMNNAVRWAYTHERYDVTQFLSGGELLIIEGSVLAGLDEQAWGAYIDALSDAKVSGLAIELVDFFTQVPLPLAERADSRNLPVIGLRRRRPFVALCQEVNTFIVREQLLAQLKVDTLSAALRSAFALAQSADDIAKALAQVIGEAVLVIDAGCNVVAQEGTAYGGRRADGEGCSSLLIPVRLHGVQVATVVVSQRFAIMDTHVKATIAMLLDDNLPPFTVQSIESRIESKLLAGAVDGLYASKGEIIEAEGMLNALGFLGCARCLVFAIVFSTLDARASDIARRLENESNRENDAGRTGVIVSLEGDTLYGCFLCDDAYARGRDFAKLCRETLGNLVSDDVWIVSGVAVAGAASLLDHFSALRYAREALDPRFGAISGMHDAIYSRFLSVAQTQKAVSVVIRQIAGNALGADRMLIRTLHAVADCAGSKTEACAQLGIKRQTLYNRLDKITELTGIEQENRKAWHALLAASQLMAIEQPNS